MRLMITVGLIIASASVCFASRDDDNAVAAVAVARARLTVIQRANLENSSNHYVPMGSKNTPSDDGRRLQRSDHFASADEISTPESEAEIVTNSSVQAVAASGRVRFEFSPQFSGASSSPYQKVAATVYTAPWCHPCHKFQKLNGSGNDLYSLTYVNEKPPRVTDESGRMIEPSIPCVVWTDLHGKQWFTSGVKTPEQLEATIEATRSTFPAAMAAGGLGTLHARSVIEQAIDIWRDRIGVTAADGSPIKVRFVWRRTGAQTLPLIHQRPEQWSAKNIFGDLGEFAIEAPGSKLPVNPISIGYKRSGDQLLIHGDIAISVAQLGLPGDQHSVQSVGAAPSGFGPITILTIVSLAKTIFDILHPTCDLTLGGQVSATVWLDDAANAFHVEFQDMPRIRLVVLYQLDLGLKNLIISPQRGHADFDGSGLSRLVKSRDFEVK